MDGNGCLTTISHVKVWMVHHPIDRLQPFFKMLWLSGSKGDTLPETNSILAPENGPKPKRKRSSSNHPFSGAKMVVSFRGDIIFECVFVAEIHFNG